MEKKPLTPRQIVDRLDQYIVGQQNAKKAVAVALRNRYRRSLLDEKLKDEVVPKNILMMGPTGVGKTEIARRIAKLAFRRHPWGFLSPIRINVALFNNMQKLKKQIQQHIIFL